MFAWRCQPCTKTIETFKDPFDEGNVSSIYVKCPHGSKQKTVCMRMIRRFSSVSLWNRSGKWKTNITSHCHYCVTVRVFKMKSATENDCKSRKHSFVRGPRRLQCCTICWTGECYSNTTNKHWKYESVRWKWKLPLLNDSFIHMVSNIVYGLFL